uniref:Uncharacterized protein n=1 Tax=Aplanochytrium stocchinoi TaxID=215587 RepID=A0A7S3LH80_9STRA|mmetsp:Transcript_5298/g.6679  ORF Transcript_5298/g.6679 Transcript_5298/m.6679 type:complete len:338 (-) Transcript_5298:211-1224(-)|eukprot:CAMPEP_0204837336 /NCGR_PEP_ID=MMETSP1346-20131115/27482_1 /ASSEMBLY_ACC=CAM_ASM_000771 /TAXON_ID=215587 /ORGANISM="Aplanochytrium stocchinoi, Strain GSBS06" /LENGTH=337 /DNA_ID=CAMNT_0051972683 /DNA_START=128 /DNA_END=1141 /DNA_ORIENTATION=-
MAASKAFNSLDDVEKDYFNEVQNKSFSQQAVAFLDAYWEEIGGQAPFIFELAWEVIKEIDMQQNKIEYIHKYQESSDLRDFDWALLFFEKLCKAVETRETEDRDSNGEIVMKGNKPAMKKWKDIPYYNISMPTMMTAVTRRTEIRDKVDFNNDGTISFLEYLIYTYKRISNASEFILRGRANREGASLNSPERMALEAAQAALDEVKRKIAEYQAAMAKHQAIIDSHNNGELDENGNLKVGKARAGRATFELKQLQGSPLAAELKQALIEAEFKVKQAMKTIREALAKKAGKGDEAKAASPGGMFWMEASMAAEKKRVKGFGLKGLVARDTLINQSV